MKFHFKKAYQAHFADEKDWQNWVWQMQKSAKSQASYEKYFALTEDEKAAFSNGESVFNIRVTPYYASLAQAQVDVDPIRRIIMPHKKELNMGVQAMLDPLGEKRNQVSSRLIHRYSDRVLFLITDVCSVYCRFCTRKHFTGHEEAFLKEADLQSSLNYIKSKKGIREVILSGGDPLTVSDSQLDRVLSSLREIDHVEIIRIGSRMPVVCPMRITDDLVKIIKKYKPVYMMTHFNHPREITEEAAMGLEKLVDNGVPVFNQMVLLNGVNNHPAIVQALSRRLLYLRVKPYYMFQCDPSQGTDHLRTSIEDSLGIQKELWGHLSGLAMPNFSVDIPNGGGKAYYVPQFEIDRQGDSRSYVGWDGVKANYISPAAETILKPIDSEIYMQEWEDIKSSKHH